MTNSSAPSLNQSIARMKREILADVKSGRIPNTCASFSELHDFLDANCLGGFCDDSIINPLIEQHGGRDTSEAMPDGLMTYLNDAQNAIDAWIKAGGIRATHYQHLRCTNDTNGNPRRVFVLYDAAGDIVRTIDEGYRGTPEEVRGLVQLPSFNITATERRELLKTRG